LHAEIEFDTDGYYITDIQSKNGTFVDGELVISRKLRNENVILIGNYTLMFQYQDGEHRHDDSDKSVTKATMVLDTPIHRSKLARSLSDVGEEKEKIQSQGVLTFLEGDKEPVILDKPLITIGKESSCDVVARGLLIGRIAAEIHRKTDGFYLKSVGGKINPKVNYKPVKSEIMLKEFDVIEIGSTKMQFYLRTA